jgi:pimeloyl-ACP methyl ester carboxylesterase
MVRRIVGWVALVIGIAFAALLLFGRTPDTDPAAMRAKYGAPPSRFVDLGNGLTMHVRDTGPRDAPAIVLLHGSNSSLQTWDGWAARLDRTWRVIRFDLPGHGLTGPHPQRDYSAAGFDDAVDRVTRKLGVERFALAGNSMGGWVAWTYAVAHPERVSRLILVDAAGAPEIAGRALPIGFRIARTPLLRDLTTIVTPRSVIERSVHQTVSNQAIVTPAAIDRYWELLRYPGNRQATLDRFATQQPPATPAAMARLTMPVLVLWGEEDKLIPLASGRWFAAHIPGSRLIVYPHIGHLPMEEATDASAADVESFLKQEKVQAAPATAKE